MNLRWLFMDYVDPQLQLTRQERRRIWGKAYIAIGRKPQTASVPPSKASLVAFVAQSLALAVCCFGPLFIWMHFFPGHTRGAYAIMLPALALTWVVMTWLGRFTWKRNVNVALRELGYDICPRCGYWLRGLGDEVKNCPECGAARQPMRRAQQ